jgi:hypothetical protein
MPASRESLNFKERSEPECAPFLFSKETIESLTDGERCGEYTLERLRQLRPEVIDEIIRLRGQFVGRLRIAKIVHVHHRTVAAVDAEYPEQIEAERRRRIYRLRSAADKLVEQIDESPENIPWNVKGLAASQLYDKAELLEGRATARVEQVHHIDIFSDFADFVKSLERQEGFEQEAGNEGKRQEISIAIDPSNAFETRCNGEKKSAISDLRALPSAASESENGS